MRTTHAIDTPPEERQQPIENATVYAAKAVYREHSNMVLMVALGVSILMWMVTMSWARSVHIEAMNHKPLVVGITAEGKPHILDSLVMILNPEDMQTAYRYFLQNWAEKFYSRVVSGFHDYEVARQFMEPRLATPDARMKARDEIKSISNGQAPQVIVSVKNVVFMDPDGMSKKGCKEESGQRCRAEIDAERVVLNSETQPPLPIKIIVEFVKLESVPREIVRENPLGFVVTDIQFTEGIR